MDRFAEYAVILAYTTPGTEQMSKKIANIVLNQHRW